MRSVTTEYTSTPSNGPHRVVQVQDLASQWAPDLSFAVLIDSASQLPEILQLQISGLTNITGVRSSNLRPGDVIAPNGSGSNSTVLYREDDAHHAIFLTNRCNSYCLMCSQPPTSNDDSWLVERAKQTIRHISKSPRSLGLTGGEPLLLG